MDARVSVALVGIGGYGDAYLEELLTNRFCVPFDLVGVVDPEAERSRRLAQLRQLGVAVYSDLDALYCVNLPDLVMIVTPIHLHAPQTALALARGSNVLCEKPLGATLEDARRMYLARQAAPRMVAIGYQWSFSRAIQLLKDDVMAGRLGRPVRLRSLACIPRGLRYFARNGWAGRLRTADGAAVFDSPINNATAHFLHNMFYVLGPQRHLSAMPASVEAELYRVNDIESCDTAAIRCRTDCGAELLFYTSHAVPGAVGPLIRYEFEQAVVTFQAGDGAGLVARFHDGRIRRYGDPGVHRHLKIWQTIAAVRSDDRYTPCGIEAAGAQTVCMAAAHASSPIHTLPDDLLTISDGVEMEPTKVAIGLSPALANCYEQARLPSQHRRFEWARPGQVVDVRGPQWSPRAGIRVTYHGPRSGRTGTYAAMATPNGGVSPPVTINP
jgi:predicted dehydrogenase